MLRSFKLLFLYPFLFCLVRVWLEVRFSGEMGNISIFLVLAAPTFHKSCQFNAHDAPDAASEHVYDETFPMNDAVTATMNILKISRLDAHFDRCVIVCVFTSLSFVYTVYIQPS